MTSSSTDRVRRRVKKTVRFIVDVHFTAGSEAFIDKLAKEYATDPCHQRFGCHVDYGSYTVKRGKLRLA